MLQNTLALLGKVKDNQKNEKQRVLLICRIPGCQNAQHGIELSYLFQSGYKSFSLSI